MVNFIHIYSFIPMSSCVDMGTSALLCPGAYKDALEQYIYNLDPSRVTDPLTIKNILANLYNA